MFFSYICPIYYLLLSCIFPTIAYSTSPSPFLTFSHLLSSSVLLSCYSFDPLFLVAFLDFFSIHYSLMSFFPIIRLLHFSSSLSYTYSILSTCSCRPHSPSPRPRLVPDPAPPPQCPSVIPIPEECHYDSYLP